jgi:hypothetical protein
LLERGIPCVEIRGSLTLAVLLRANRREVEISRQAGMLQPRAENNARDKRRN